MAGIITQRRKEDGSEDLSEASDSTELNDHAASLIRAVHAKDEQGVADALRAAFEQMDAAPHVEGEHINEEDTE